MYYIALDHKVDGNESSQATQGGWIGCWEVGIVSFEGGATFLQCKKSSIGR